MDLKTGKLISILYRKSQIYFGKALKSCNVGAAEFPALLYMYEHHGLTQEELALHLCLDKSAVTRIVRSLLNKNYITREKDEKDLRCNHLHITPEGLAIKTQIEDSLNSWNEILMKGMDPTQQDELYNYLLQMVENVKGEL